MLVTIFEDVYGRDLTAEDMTLEELYGRVEKSQAPRKEALPLLKLARFGSLRTPPDPSNPRRGNSLRHDGNVVSVSGIELDYDGEQMAFAEAVNRLEAADVCFVAYSSPSHMPATPRWRVLLPLTAERAASERRRYVAWCNGILGGGLARESWVLSQSFFFGGIDGPPAEIYLGDNERCIDEADFQAIAQPYTRGARGTTGTPQAKPDFDKMTEPELLDVIHSGAHYWGPAKRLLTMWAKLGISQGDAEANLTSAFDDVPQADRGAKWAKYRKRIPTWVADCFAKALKIAETAAFVQLIAALDGEPQWQRAIVTNTFTGQPEVCTPWPPQAGQTASRYRELTDADALELLAHVQANGAPYARKNMVWDVITLVASRNERHPPRDYLRSLKWDGGERDDRLFIVHFPGELPDPEQDQQHYDNTVAYYEHTAMCVLVGLVARVFQPGSKLDTLPCLIGPQGFLKSQGLQALMPDPAWFSDDLATTVGDRDAKESMTGKWLVELSEFPHIRRDVDKVKAFFSRQTDRYRKAYGRASGDHPRQCGFCATANALKLIDVTGSRRIWPIPLSGRVDVEAIRRDRDQLWAEAVHWYDQGYEWWLSPSLDAIAAFFQDVYAEEDAWDELILDALDHLYPLDPDGERPPFTLHAVLKGIGFCFIQGEPNCAKKSDEVRLRDRLRRLGYEPSPHRTRASGRERVWLARKGARV